MYLIYDRLFMLEDKVMFMIWVWIFVGVFIFVVFYILIKNKGVVVNFSGGRNVVLVN